MNEIDPGQLKAILVRIIQITNADRIEIYPLDDDLVQTKFVKGVYKNHLHGLLFKLDMLYVWRNTITVKNNFEALPGLFSDSSIAIDVNQVRDSNGCRRYYVKIPLQIFVCLASDCFGFSYTNISVHYTISQATQSRKFE